jgi:Ni/Fe-hydrogenase 1 B-type cytochrome subunit
VSALAEPSSRRGGKEAIYVWELPVRIIHWVLFFAIIILSVTGYYIGDPFVGVPGPASRHFVMGTMRAIHLYTAIVFGLAVLLRFYWAFVGNRYARLTELFPLSLRRLRSLWETLLFYSFIRRNPPPYPGHDGAAGASYGLIFLVYLLLTATGLALYTVYAPVNSPFQFFRILVPVFGGLPVARLIHHICMWVVWIFVVIHIYSVVLWSFVERSGEIDSMFSGYKFFPRVGREDAL